MKSIKFVFVALLFINAFASVTYLNKSIVAVSNSLDDKKDKDLISSCTCSNPYGQIGDYTCKNNVPYRCRNNSGSICSWEQGAGTCQN